MSSRSPRRSRRRRARDPMADEVEQRQRPDGGLEDEETAVDWADDVLSPDVIEQHQYPDGSVEEPELHGELPDEPISPDILDQHRLVEDDDSYDDVDP